MQCAQNMGPGNPAEDSRPHTITTVVLEMHYYTLSNFSESAQERMLTSIFTATLGSQLSSNEQMLQKARQESSHAFGNMHDPNWGSSPSCLRVNETPLRCGRKLLAATTMGKNLPASK